MWTLHDRARHLLLCRCPGGEFVTLSNGTRLPNPVHQERVANGACMNRCAKCGLVPRVKQIDLPLDRSERGAYRFGGVVVCDHWTCPSCGTRYAREVASKLGCAIKAWLADNDGYRETEAPRDVWLFTPTIPHKATDAMETTVALLYATWALFVQDRAWRAWCARVGVQARVRAFDVTFGGKNGTHPHFHVALFVDNVPGFRWGASLARAATGDTTGFQVPAQLVDAWRRAAGRAGVTVGNEAAFRDFSLQLQGGDAAAAYFTKWGLSSEAGGSALKKDGPFGLLRASVAGDQHAGEVYRAFCLAVNGRQVVSGIKDTLSIVGVSDDDVARYSVERQAFLDEAHPPTLVPPLALVVRRWLWSRAVTVGFGAVVAEVDRAAGAGEDPQGALDAFLWKIVPRAVAQREAPS